MLPSDQQTDEPAEHANGAASAGHADVRRDGPSATAARVAACVLHGAAPNATREDLLCDVVGLWDEIPPDDHAWDAAATALATVVDLHRAAACHSRARPAVPAYSALLEALNDCAMGHAPAERARARLEDLLGALEAASESL